MKVLLEVHLCRDPRLFLTYVHRWCWCGEDIREKGPNVWPASCRRHSGNAVWVLFCLGFSPSLFPSFSFTLPCSWPWLRKPWEWSHNRQDVGGRPAQFFSNFNVHVNLSCFFKDRFWFRKSWAGTEIPYLWKFPGDASLLYVDQSLITKLLENCLSKMHREKNLDVDLCWGVVNVSVSFCTHLFRSGFTLSYPLNSTLKPTGFLSFPQCWAPVKLQSKCTLNYVLKIRRFNLSHFFKTMEIKNSEWRNLKVGWKPKYSCNFMKREKNGWLQYSRRHQ